MAEQLPAAVQSTHEFLQEREVWHVLTPNKDNREVGSCRDAAKGRNRLGERGIPLWDELKTLAFRVEGAGGAADSMVMAHCRGDRRFDLAAIARARGVDVSALQRLETEDLESLSMGYGLVNPFQDMGDTVLHLFDSDLLKRIGVPGTVMTNAGDHSWGVGLYAPTLFEELPNAREAAISTVDPEEEERPKWAVDPQHLGLITGNSSESGMLLWQLINDNIRRGMGRYAIYGDIVMPRMSPESVPELGFTMQLAEWHEQVRPHLLNAVRSVCERGANLISIACNTTPWFSGEIREVTSEYDARFISMPEEVGKRLRADGVTSVELVAASVVARLGEWSAYRKPLSGIDVHIPQEDILERIDKIADDVKARKATLDDLSRLTNIVKTFEPGSDVLFALTEISQVLALRSPRHQDRVRVIDSMGIYAEAIAEQYVGHPIPDVEDLDPEDPDLEITL